MAMAWTNYLLVAAGGAAGAVARMAVGNLVRGTVAASAFPWHTFVINVSGSFALGMVASVVAGRATGSAASVNHFAAIGFLGAYTTFSTFELETWNLVSQGRWPAALLYVMVSVMAGFAGLGLGIWAGRLI